MKTVYGVVSFFLIFFLVLLPARGEDLPVLTTAWIPYSFEKDGELTGLSTEIVREILKEAGLKGDFQSGSWNRAIIRAKTRKNVLIYPLMRIKDREDDFIWAVPIFNAKLSLFKLARNDKVDVQDLDDARQYTIGVLKGAAMHRFLLSKGFEDNRQLQIFYANRKSVELLFRDRIDLVADNPLVVSWEVKQLARSGIAEVSFDRRLLEEVLTLTQSPAYLALGKDSSPEYVTRLHKAFKTLEDRGDLNKIRARYR
jgi:polar amino acid transport system substrate-binding protein